MSFFLHRKKDHQSSHVSSDNCLGSEELLFFRPPTRETGRPAHVTMSASLTIPYCQDILSVSDPDELTLSKHSGQQPDEIADFDVPLCPVPLMSNEQIWAS